MSLMSCSPYHRLGKRKTSTSAVRATLTTTATGMLAWCAARPARHGQPAPGDRLRAAVQLHRQQALELPRPVNAVAPPRAAHQANIPVAVVVSVALTALVLVFLLPNLW